MVRITLLIGICRSAQPTNSTAPTGWRGQPRPRFIIITIPNCRVHAEATTTGRKIGRRDEEERRHVHDAAEQQERQ
jgi:hypothetical protein